MDLKQLRAFVALFEELHFGRAAKRLHLSQSALSGSVSLRDERLGVRLMHFAVSSRHRLAGLTRPRLASIAAEPLVIPSRSHRPILFDTIHEFLRGKGFEPTVRQSVNERHTAIAMVAAGLGISIVPAWVARFSHPDVVFRPLPGGAPLVEVHAVWRRGGVASRGRRSGGCSTRCPIRLIRGERGPTGWGPRSRRRAGSMAARSPGSPPTPPPNRPRCARRWPRRSSTVAGALLGVRADRDRAVTALGESVDLLAQFGQVPGADRAMQAAVEAQQGAALGRLGRQVEGAVIQGGHGQGGGGFARQQLGDESDG